jgi:hypothetical protein
MPISSFNNGRGHITHVGKDNLGQDRKVQSVVRGDGIVSMPIDGTVTVQSTFGFDQQPDTFFKIINTGGAGTTWTIDVAGTANDLSVPDRDVPAYQKIFTVLIGEQGNELEFRDRIISELNQDTTFKTDSLLRAAKATHRGIVHISSINFSASGEFYERPFAGDFTVTIGGAPGDGVVIVGFDNLISRSKPVTITRDFDSPHRLGLFGITGDVNVTSKALSDLFIERASIGGLDVDFDMTVNGSVTPVVFDVLAQIDTAIFVQELRFYGQGNGIKFANFLNLNSPLTNGIIIQIKSENIITELLPIRTTEDFKNKFSFPGAGSFRLDVAAGRDDFLATFVFGNPFLLTESGSNGIGNDDFIKVFINDNLTSVGSLELIAKGFQKEP